jgi:hypothetical protein
VPGALEVEATGPDGAVVSFTPPTASDLVDGVDAVHCSKPSGATFPLGTTTVSCTATDAHGNTAEASFTITVKDTTAPSISGVPGALEVEATGPDGAVVSFTPPTASDLVDGAVAVHCSKASGATFPLGTTTVSCTAVDAHGNGAEASFTVTVKDTTAPTISGVPGTIEVEATGPAGAVVSYTAPTASDLVDGVVAVNCSKASGATFPLGTTTVNCTATDAHGNTAEASFSVTVKDTTAPALSLPGTLEVEATGPSGAVVSYSVSANDLVDGDRPVSCSKPSGATFPLGDTVVSCSAVDDHGNMATNSFIVRVVDSTKPVLVGPGDLTLEATGPMTVVNFAVTASDAVDGALTPTCTPASGSSFPVGTTKITCWATDSHGNTGVLEFNVNVVDTTKPELTVPADMVLTATSPAGTVANYTVSATDLTGPVTAAASPPSGSVCPLGTHPVSCTATDSHGNVTQKSFNVTVIYGWSNVLQPINADGTSIFKLGSTIPVKFKLMGASGGITNATARLYCAKMSSGVAGTELEAISTSAADSGNTFRYDSTGGQYIFNLGTKSLSEGTWQLRIDLGDGVTHTVFISLKK